MAEGQQTTPNLSAFSQLTAGQKGWLGLMGLGGALQSFSSIFSGYAENRYQQAVARSLETQARLVRLAADRQRTVNIMETAEKTHAVAVAGREKVATQKAAIAAQGGDISSMSAEALVLDTTDKQIEDINALNASLQFANNELTQEAEIRAILLQGNAEAARRQGKAAIGAGWASAGSTIINTATNIYGMSEMWGAKTGKVNTGITGSKANEQANLFSKYQPVEYKGPLRLK